ncbi:MAG: hydrolase [Micrococcales bacterium]|nr:hydrolase [Micrococcales bacterium]
MPLTLDELAKWLRPPGGWPQWAVGVPYLGAAHPQAAQLPPLAQGANCQRYAFAVLELFGRRVPPHRSSELWGDSSFAHVAPDEATSLDLALFGATHDAWGAHVAVVIGDDALLHLCAEVGEPAIWRWCDFAARARYTHVVGVLRPPTAGRTEPPAVSPRGRWRTPPPDRASSTS